MTRQRVAGAQGLNAEPEHQIHGVDAWNRPLPIGNELQAGVCRVVRQRMDFDLRKIGQRAGRI